MTTSSYQTILVEKTAGRCDLTLNRPAARNAMSTQMIREMLSVVEEIQDDRSIRSLVVRGSGGTFCAGGDLQEFQQLFQSDISTEDVATENRLLGTFLTALNELPQTVIMLVEGAAIGGGLGLVCVSDVAIATSETRFSLSETSLGIPPAQIAAFVVQRIGLTHARRLMLTGARFLADEAEKLGLVHWSVPDAEAMESSVENVLTLIERCSPNANATTKQILHSTQRDSLSATLDRASQLFAESLRSEDGREGVAAFLEKRKTNWTAG